MAERINTDILVIGGSLAGMAAAITAKEADPETEVTVVEKYTAGYAGKANRGAGIMTMLGDAKPEDYVAYHTKYIGDYLNDQEAQLQYAENLNRGVELLDKWSGGKIDKKEDGSFKTLKWLAQVQGKDENGQFIFDEPDHFPWTLVAIDLDFMVNVRKYAQKAGIRFVDRTGVVDLLLAEGKISGAVAYNIDDGSQTVFQAKAVVLATGSQNYRIMPMWSPGRGEGLAAAFRAGAKFRNCEFGSFYNWTSLQNFESSMGVEFALYNDKGENVGLAHTQGEHPDVDQNSLAEWYKQTVAGNGPMHYRQQENPLMPYLMTTLACDDYFHRPFADTFWGSLFFNAYSQQTSDEIVPGLIGEFSGLMVDKDMKTTLDGLFAAGDICYGGSAAAGAVPPPPGRVRGSGLAFAQNSGCIAGRSVSDYVKNAPVCTFDEGDVAEIDERFMKPMKQGGSVKVMEFLPKIHRVMQPLENSLYRKEERLQAALTEIEKLQAELETLKAESAHDLFGCNEIQSMLLCAKLFFTTSLHRKESRGWFLREDYPDHSKELTWYTATPTGEGTDFVVAPMKLPIDRYPNKEAE